MSIIKTRKMESGDYLKQGNVNRNQLIHLFTFMKKKDIKNVFQAINEWNKEYSLVDGNDGVICHSEALGFGHEYIQTNAIRSSSPSEKWYRHYINGTIEEIVSNTGIRIPF